MAKTNRTVVRNEAYHRGSLNVRERHNERKNENYFNADIIPERANLNVHFKKCEETYEQTFDKLLSGGAISTRGLKDDAKIVDEFIFDVNTDYFEKNGNYEYAKKFFEEAYRLAVKEVGNEDYILSSVMPPTKKILRCHRNSDATFIIIIFMLYMFQSLKKKFILTKIIKIQSSQASSKRSFIK